MGSNRSLPVSNAQEMVGNDPLQVPQKYLLEVMPMLSFGIPIIDFSLKRAKGSIFVDHFHRK
jgi:hypothetical protein